MGQGDFYAPCLLLFSCALLKSTMSAYDKTEERLKRRRTHLERGEDARRRQEILEQTRRFYGDRETPAIHPRYRAAYRKIYDEDSEEVTETFGARVVLCILLFVAFVIMDNQEIDIAQVSSDQIVTLVEEETPIQEVWMGLVEAVK